MTDRGAPTPPLTPPPGRPGCRSKVRVRGMGGDSTTERTMNATYTLDDGRELWLDVSCDGTPGVWHWRLIECSGYGRRSEREVGRGVRGTMVGAVMKGQEAVVALLRDSKLAGV